jgi:hypothetical protein
MCIAFGFIASLIVSSNQLNIFHILPEKGHGPWQIQHIFYFSLEICNTIFQHALLRHISEENTLMYPSFSVCLFLLPLVFCVLDIST